jgi:drug/metabolite transporter (DMT)-like permease
MIAGSSFAAILALNVGLAGLRHIDFARASVIRSLSPVSTVAVSLVFFPVHLSALNWAGGALTIVSLMLGSTIEKYFFSGKSKGVQIEKLC